MADGRTDLPNMDDAQAGHRFATTRWSMVLSAAARGTPEGRRAIDDLCAAYWYPLYAYARRKGYGAEDAQDITQGFLAQFIERDCVSSAQRERGKFRTFLLVCLRNYMANVRAAEGALRRGGGRKTLSFDAGDAEQRYRLEPADEQTAERTFERNWALAVLERALEQVGQEFAARGRGRVFETLKVYLTGDDLAPPHAKAAEELQMNETAVRVAIHRLRDRYRQAVEEEIRQTMQQQDGEASIEQEIGDLFRALSEARRST